MSLFGFNSRFLQGFRKSTGVTISLYLQSGHSSTQTIFRLSGDTTMLFDEYFNNPNWERQEFKAFQELVAERQIKYTYLGYARQQVLVRIDSVGASIA
jgi:hypothetical protein